jgi:hypothetical protein
VVYQSAHAAPPADATYVQPAPWSPMPPKRRRTGMLVATGLVVLVALGILGAFAYVKTQASATFAQSRQPANVSCEHGTLANGACAAENKPPESYPTPKPSDFTMTMKVTEKKCFGSAGCNVGFELTLVYIGPALRPDSTWDVTYDVTGADDPYTNTMTVTCDSNGQPFEYRQEDNEMVQTAKSSSKLTIVVTAVAAA